MDVNSRLILIAPHPDDETIPTGILLQQAVETGASVRIIYLTSGDNNPWPQRYIEHQWKISENDRARWGERRRKEALAALAHLGVKPDDAVFSGYPDQGITEMLMNGDDQLVSSLTEKIIQRRPTLLITPSLYDLHADHSAAAVFIRQMMVRLQKDLPHLLLLEYLVHTRKKDLPPGDILTLPLAPAQQIKKRLAILSHESQVRLRPKELPAYADRPERFIRRAGAPDKVDYYHPVRDASCSADTLILKLAMSPCPGAFGPRTLYLAANSQGMAGARFKMPLPFFSKGMMVDVVGTSGKTNAGRAWFCGGPRRAEVQIPLAALMPADQIFVKIKRKYGFFDEAGWREIPICN